MPKESEFVQSPKQTPPLVSDSSRGSMESADLHPLGSLSGLCGALEQAIEEAKKYQHLPLDDDEDEKEDGQHREDLGSPLANGAVSGRHS